MMKYMNQIAGNLSASCHRISLSTQLPRTAETKLFLKEKNNLFKYKAFKPNARGQDINYKIYKKYHN